MFNDLVRFAKVNNKYDGMTGSAYSERMYRAATGQVDMNMADSMGGRALATGAGTFRSTEVAAQLGGAVISSVSDTFLSGMQSAMVGMNPLSTLAKGFAVMGERIYKGGTPAERELFAARIGIASDAFMTEVRNNRWSETGGGNETMQKLAEGVIRGSGLTAWTNALRTTWSLEFTGLLADNIGKRLDEFPFGKRMKKMYGFTDEDWAKVTADATTGVEHGNYLDTTKLYKSDRELALRLQDMVGTESNYAVLMPDSRTRSVTTFGAAKGTPTGEISRTVSTFKSFPIALMTAQYGRIAQIDSIAGRVAYGASSIVGLSLLGTGVVQLKDMMKGKEPMDIDSPTLWHRGLMQGGGLGLMGDLLFKEQTRFGQNASEALFLGIGAKPLDDVKRIHDAYTGLNEDANLLSELTAVGLDYVPAKNLWYTRLLYERAISDQLKSMTNPKHSARLRKQAKRMKKETGQTYWMPPTK